METKKRKNLEARGWRVAGAKEFLHLSDNELHYIEIKLALSQKLREVRQGMSLTQEQAARLVRSSQSRLAKMEAGDASVSVDLLLKTLIAFGVSRQVLADVISSGAPAAA
jgi:DNA-binding XRE family transcriptional regulator